MTTSILVVEDLEDDYLLLARAFTRAKIPVDLKWAKNGAEAKEMLLDILAVRPNKSLPAFILSDIKMPHVNGFELLEWIRAQEYLRRLPFIVMTSSSADVDTAKAYDLGANGYIVKPITTQEIEGCARAIQQFWILHNKGPTFW